MDAGGRGRPCTGEHTFGTLGTVGMPAARQVCEGWERAAAVAGHGAVLTVLPALRGLFPDGGMRRGSVVAVEGGAGSTSLLLALLAGAGGDGAWAAAVGVPSLGLEAAAAAGVSLERLLVIPRPGRVWPAVAAAMLDALDMVVLGAPGECREPDERRLAARARERKAVLVLASPRTSGMPEGARGAGRAWRSGVDLRLGVDESRWEGAGRGAGRLLGRRAAVRSWGRGAAARERRVDLLLPGADGSIRAVPSPSPAETGVQAAALATPAALVPILGTEASEASEASGTSGAMAG